MKKIKEIRVGVVGVGRGSGFARGAGPQLGMKLVALCDTWEERLEQVGKEFNVATYTDYDTFLEHDMDAVILANYFHEHAPFAVKALRAGKHVMSETAACFTLAEGVELIDTVEKTGKTYMFAENYPYMVFNQEMRRVYRSGKIGEFMYGEGEYVHPVDAEFLNRISPGLFMQIRVFSFCIHHKILIVNILNRSHLLTHLRKMLDQGSKYCCLARLSVTADLKYFHNSFL